MTYRCALSTAICLAAIGMLSLPCLASPLDYNGDYWYGWYGADATAVSSGTAGSGVMAMTTPTTGTFNASGAASTAPGTFSESHTITNWINDADNWTTLIFQGEPQQPVMAFSPFLGLGVDRMARPEGLGVNLGVRKAAVTTDTSAIAGNYMYISHEFSAGYSSMERGSIAINANNTLSGVFYDVFGTPTPTHTISAGATWNYVSGQPQIDVNDSGDTFRLNLGLGQHIGRISWDSQTGATKTELITRIKTGRSLSEIDGTWLTQGLLTNYVSSAGTPETVWGKLTVSSSTGTFTWTYDDSTGGGSTTITGLATLMDTTGMIGFSNGSVGLRGYMDMTADTLVLGYLDSSKQGIMISVRSVPEPATMVLLAGGALGMLVKRNRRGR